MVAMVPSSSMGLSLTKSAEKPRHSCRGGIGLGRAGLNAQEPNKTHAVPEPSMGEGTAEREAPAFMPGRTSPPSGFDRNMRSNWILRNASILHVDASFKNP